MATEQSKKLSALDVNFIKMDEQQDVFITPDPAKPDVTGYVLTSQDENGKVKWEELPDSRLFTVEPTAVITDVDIEYTPAQIYGGLIRRAPTADSDDTFPTATSIASYITSIGGELQVGTAFKFVISNTSDTFDITSIENTGITFIGFLATDGIRAGADQDGTFMLYFTDVTSGLETANVIATDF